MPRRDDLRAVLVMVEVGAGIAACVAVVGTVLTLVGVILR